MSSRSSPLSFEIKSATLPLVSVLIKSLDLATLSADMHSRFGDNPDFFDNDAVLIDLHGAEGSLDLNGLLQLLRRYRLNPVACGLATPRMKRRRPWRVCLSAAKHVFCLR